MARSQQVAVVAINSSTTHKRSVAKSKAAPPKKTKAASKSKVVSKTKHAHTKKPRSRHQIGGGGRLYRVQDSM